MPSPFLERPDSDWMVSNELAFDLPDPRGGVRHVIPGKGGTAAW